MLRSPLLVPVINLTFFLLVRHARAFVLPAGSTCKKVTYLQVHPFPLVRALPAPLPPICYRRLATFSRRQGGTIRRRAESSNISSQQTGACGQEASSISSVQSRNDLVAAKKTKMAKIEAKKALMTSARRERMRRHRRKKELQARNMTRAEREARQEREARVAAWLESIYEEDADLSAHAVSPRLRIAIDLAYDASSSLYSSLARQLGCVYGLMRRAGEPGLVPSVHLTAAKGDVLEALEASGGRAWRMHRHDASVFEVFADKDALIYLSPDSPTVLERVDPTKVYVIGGLVDRVVLKNKSLSRASLHGVATARLPLKEFFGRQGRRGDKYVSDMALAVDRVVEILMKQYEVNNWDQALAAVFPGAVRKDDEEEGGQGVKDSEGSGGEKCPQ